MTISLFDVMTDKPTTDEEADFALLSFANEKGKFWLQVGCMPDQHLQLALERGIDKEWFRLGDISPIAMYPRKLFRLFYLTPNGWARLRELQRKFSPGTFHEH